MEGDDLSLISHWVMSCMHFLEIYTFIMYFVMFVDEEVKIHLI